jgi:hypothetical protein
MKRLIKSYYDNVGMTPEQKQELLEDIVKANSAESGSRRAVWKAAAIVAAVAVIVLVAVWSSSQMSNGNESAADKVAVLQSTAPQQTQAAVTAVGAMNYDTAIVLSVNPDVEIRMDAEGVVTEVVGLNEDGVALVEGIDFSGMSLENATIMVVNQLILQGYITAAEIQEEINISLSSDTVTLDNLSVMTNVIKTVAAEQNIAVDVIEDADLNSLQVVLEGEGGPDVWPELPPVEDEENPAPEENTAPDEETPAEEPTPSADMEVGLEVEFLMAGGGHSAYVENVLVHTEDGDTINNMLDFAGMRLNRAALLGLVELLDKGYISDEDAKSVRLLFTGSCGVEDIEDVAALAALLMAEYDERIALTTDTENKEIWLTPDKTVTYEKQESKFALRDVLNQMVNKDEEDLSPRQIAILKTAFNFREYQNLMEKRYYVLVPDLVGMTEEKAVEVLQQLGLCPAVVREKVPGFDPEKENGGLKKRDDLLSPEDQGQVYEPTWDYPVVDFGCVFYQDCAPGFPNQTGMHVQINVIVPLDDERPEMTDYREDSGIVIREMDEPFDISGYPDSFPLSEAERFEAMIKEMNATYTIENKADYTVMINRNTGWEGTAVITIEHKDGFPRSQFFLQDGCIIEHEFLWRRDAPTAEDRG